MSKEMKWCCTVFKERYSEAGDRSFAILVGRNREGEPEFILQHRSVDKGAEGDVRSETSNISLVSDIHILYCPWCGRKLHSWYGKYVDELYRPGFKVTIPGLDDH